MNARAWIKSPAAMRCMTQAELYEAINSEHDQPPWESDPVPAVDPGNAAQPSNSMVPNRIAALEAELEIASSTVLLMAVRIKQLADEREDLVAALRQACPLAVLTTVQAPTPRMMPARAMRAPKRDGWQAMR